jgi:methenyltetrahydrofolate cyclohydrolase
MATSSASSDTLAGAEGRPLLDTLQRSGPVPLYRQLAAVLRADMDAGRLRPGERLATEFELMERFKVSRTTVRQTIELLRREGLIAVQRGKGTFIRGGRDAERRAGPLPIAEETVRGLLDRVAQPSPAPGGGAVAATAAALAAALVAMVAGIAGRRQGSPRLAAVEHRMNEVRARLPVLADDDIEAYRAVLLARRLPAERRGAAVSRALGRAAEVPLDCARAAAGVLADAADIVEEARPSTLADLGVAAALAWAALDAAVLTARANLEHLDDVEAVSICQAQLGQLVSGGEQSRRRVTAAIARRM